MKRARFTEQQIIGVLASLGRSGLCPVLPFDAAGAGRPVWQSRLTRQRDDTAAGNIHHVAFDVEDIGKQGLVNDGGR